MYQDFMVYSPLVHVYRAETPQIYVIPLFPVCSDDSDEEDDNRSSNSSEVETMRTVVFTFLNSASELEIAAIPGCSKKKAEIILEHRPYRHWQHLVSTCCWKWFYRNDLIYLLCI